MNRVGVICRRILQVNLRLEKIESAALRSRILLTNGVTGSVVPWHCPESPATFTALKPFQGVAPAPRSETPTKKLEVWWERVKKSCESTSRFSPSHPPTPSISDGNDTKWHPLRPLRYLFPLFPATGAPRRTSRLLVSCLRRSSAASSLLDLTSSPTLDEPATSAPFPKMTAFRPRRAPRRLRMATRVI